MIDYKPLEDKEQCKKCLHYQVCANVMKNQLHIREKLLKEKPECEHFVSVTDGDEYITDRERLTKHWGNNCVATKLNYDFLLSLPNIEVKNFNAIIQKLAHYEDLEEQGKIIVPPCKVGDTVYFTNDDYRRSAEIDGIHIDEQGVHFGWVQYDVGVDIIELWDEGEFDIDEIGKTVFLTFEEYEKALAGNEVKE